jgi:PAS domain S-box-containing protein
MKSELYPDTTESEEKKSAVAITDDNGKFITVNKQVAELYKYDREELIGMHFTDLLADPDVESGRNYERMLSKSVETEAEIIRGDGVHCTISMNTKPVKIEGERCIRAVIELVEEKITTTDTETKLSQLDYANACGEEKQEIARNIRIDTPCGKMTLQAIVMDLIEGHSDVNQYKNGAFTMYQSINKRLIEEEKRNPDSKQSDVLREAKCMAFGLYNRIQKGDWEFHGKEGNYPE